MFKTHPSTTYGYLDTLQMEVEALEGLIEKMHHDHSEKGRLALKVFQQQLAERSRRLQELLPGSQGQTRPA